MKRMIHRAFACALVLALSPHSAGAANKVAGGVIGNGGTPASGAIAAGHAVFGTLGQAVTGRASGVTRNLCEGFWCAGGVRVLAVDDGRGGAHAPSVLAFGAPYPNPTLDRARIALSLPKAADVRVGLYDVQGRLAGGMHAGRLDPGVYTLEWDGTDGDGHASGPGVFFARLELDGRFVAERRFVRLR